MSSIFDFLVSQRDTSVVHYGLTPHINNHFLKYTSVSWWIKTYNFNFYHSEKTNKKSLILSYAFWHTKTIVNLPATTTTKTMLFLMFPVGEKKLSPFRAV